MAGEELTDVVLCYQAMGLSLDATPATIQRKYNALAESYKKKLADPAMKDEAQASLDLLSEMFEKIRRSITYQTAEMEQERKNRPVGESGDGEPAFVRPVHEAVLDRAIMTSCPHCNGSIVIGTRDCPICKRTILTTGEKIAAHFTTKRVILYVVLLAVIALAALRVVSPDLFPGGQPEVDFEKSK